MESGRERAHEAEMRKKRREEKSGRSGDLGKTYVFVNVFNTHP